MPRTLLTACLMLSTLAAQPEPRWRELNRIARQAMEAKDYAKLHATLLELRPLMPGNPRITYNLAACAARLGDRDAALAGLRNLAAMGLIYDLAADEDFASLKASSEFAAILDKIAANRQPVTHSTEAFPIAGADLIPEDIAYDAKSRRFLVSSVRQARIQTPQGTPFAQADWSVLALAVDAKRRLLWATTAWTPPCERCAKSDDGKTALLAYDLDSSALKRTIDAPLKGVLGDMTIGRDGTIYVTQGPPGAVFRLAPGANVLERLDPPGEFPSPQTPALSPDEKTLYVPDYLRGIAAIDLATRRLTWLQPSDDIAVSGIDGLYVIGDSFLAVQNGTTPARLIRFSRDLRSQQVLEANTPGLGEPTHGVAVNNHFYFLANSGWDAFDRNGTKKPGVEKVQSTVRKLQLFPPSRTFRPSAAYR